MADGPVLAVRELVKVFDSRGGKPPKIALRNVSFELARGRFLAVVGPSGSGKSTLARCVAGFETVTSGTVRVAGPVQLIFQQPAASLNPRFTAAEIVTEPLWIQGCRDRKLLSERARAAVRLVGLPETALGSSAHRFSGGERQRLAIARALVTEPALLVLDESFAGLDLSVQAQVSTLLLGLQAQRGLSLILISHDLGIAARLAQEIAVMDDGRIVEHRSAGALLAHPEHPKARELVAAARTFSLGGAPA
jgi:peptide/nickel transport system ATP-binding protein